MWKTRNLFFIVVVGIVIFFIFSRKSDPTSERTAFGTLIDKIVPPSNPQDQPAEAVVGATPQVATTGTVVPVNDQDFKKWIDDEAKNVEAQVANPDLKKNEILDRVKQLTPEQMAELKKVALNSETAINKRIFSSYAISLSLNEQDLYDVAAAAVPDLGPIQPHSVNEVKKAQEYAIRYAQIDELAHQAIVNDKSLNLLKKLSVEASDSQIRSYAARKLSEFQPK